MVDAPEALSIVQTWRYFLHLGSRVDWGVSSDYVVSAGAVGILATWDAPPASAILTTDARDQIKARACQTAGT